MSTRGAIVKTSDQGKTFVGRYHHWDSYPDGLGKTLVEAYYGFFKKDLKKMLKLLCDDHPAGWSTINNADFSKEPGYCENGFATEGPTEGPKCYCHGGRKQDESIITEKDASDCGCEYVYAFDEKENKLYVLSSYTEDDDGGSRRKMIGRFGMGDPDAIWKPIKLIDLNHEMELAMEQMAEEEAVAE